MSVVELSKSVDSLAKLITERTQELEKLKHQYNAKLQAVNTYLEEIQQAVSDTHETETLDDTSFVEAIGTAVSCSKCQTQVYQNGSDCKYILLPKQKLQLLGIEKTPDIDDRLASLKVSTGRVPAAIHDYPKNTPKYHENSKSKRICSYCKKPGHSRAKCHVRLSTPAATPP